MIRSGERGAAELTLSQCLEILARRRAAFLGAWAFVFAASLLYAFLAPPVYEGSVLIELAKPGREEGLRRGGGITAAEVDEYLQTELRRLESDMLGRQVYDELRLDRVPEFAGPDGIGKFQAAVEISRVPRTYLAHVRAYSRDPELAARIANALTAKYVQDHVDSAVFMSRDVLKRLHPRLPPAERRRIYHSLPAVVENELIQDAKAQKAEVDGRLAELSKRFKPSHPEAAGLRARSEALNRFIERETENIVNSLRAQLSGTFLPNYVRVLDPAAAPAAPIRPNKPLLAALGLLAGLVLGLFAAAVAESLDQSIRTEDDVQREIQETLLGVVPHARHLDGGRRGLELAPNDPTIDAFRDLRNFANAAGIAGRGSPLLVTSSVNDEGKSVVAANLAAAFSRAGERVLLIEGDLRRPSVHKKFGVAPERGVCDYLATGSTLALEELVRPGGMSNLSILTCGACPPNPSELLNSPRLAALVAWAADAYDRVIVDCPPMFPVSDTLLWSRQARSALFVIRFAETPAPLIRSACARLKAGGIDTLGVVINAARLSGPVYGAGYRERTDRAPAPR